MNLMYSCKKVAELISQSLDEPLGPVDAIRLRLHLSMCSNCANIDKQLRAVKNASSKLFSDELPDGDDSPR